MQHSLERGHYVGLDELFVAQENAHVMQVVGLRRDAARREEDEVGGRGRVRDDERHEHVGKGVRYGAPAEDDLHHDRG